MSRFTSLLPAVRSIGWCENMTKENIDKSEDLEFTEKMQERGWREIAHSERPNAAIGRARAASKNRITIFLDGEVLDFFKQAAEKTGDGYQTLINRTLRELVSAGFESPITEAKLFDKDFLAKLKRGLETV